MGGLARRYPIEHSGPQPITRVDKLNYTEDTHPRGIKGAYVDEDTRGLEKGKYNAKFLPAWYGKKEDCHARV